MKELTNILNDEGIGHDINIDRSFAVLVLVNDDTNEAEYIMDALVEVCDMEFDDALKRAAEAHYTGETIIADGDNDYINNLKKQFDKLGIVTKIQKGDAA